MVPVFFLVLAIGIAAPLFRSLRSRMLALCASFAIVLMAYSYTVSSPEAVGGAASVANRRQALFIVACESLVLLFAAIASRRKAMFWLGWASHVLLTVLCVTVVIWLEFFWHW